MASNKKVNPSKITRLHLEVLEDRNAPNSLLSLGDALNAELSPLSTYAPPHFPN